jgi:hypothetical protein
VADDGLVPGIRGTGPARRTLLIAAAAALPVLLTACRGVEVLGTPPPPPADVETLRSAIEHEAALVANYAALTAAAGSTAAGAEGAGAGGAGSGAAGGRTAAALAVVLADHRQHLAQLKSRLVEPAGHSSAAAGAAAGRGGTLRTIAQLEQAEQAASDRLIAQLAGLPPTLAQLFASIAASEATHVPYLKAARRGR